MAGRSRSRNRSLHRPPPRREPPRRLPRRLRNGLRLALVFAALVAVNVYVFFFRRGTSLDAVFHAASVKTLSRTGETLAPSVSPAGVTRAQVSARPSLTVTPRAGESFAESLAGAGVARADRVAIEAVLGGPHHAAQAARRGLRIVFGSDGRPTTLIVRAAPGGHPLLVHRERDGRYRRIGAAR